MATIGVASVDWLSRRRKKKPWNSLKLMSNLTQRDCQPWQEAGKLAREMLENSLTIRRAERGENLSML